MAHGPDGQWRPRGAGACAVHVMKIATRQIQESRERPKKAKPGGAPLAVRNGTACNPNFALRRAALITPERRARMAKS